MSRRQAMLCAAVALGLLLLSTDGLLAQCAMCRGALESPEGRQMAQAFNRGILLLLAVPFAAVGTISLLIYRAVRRHRSSVPQAENLRT